MRRCLCSILATLTGCLSLADGGDPDAPLQPLSKLSGIKLEMSAGPSEVFVSITVDALANGACPVLDDSFQATLDGTPMTITSRGTSLDSIYSSGPCGWPHVELDHPPPADHASIAMIDPGHVIAVDLLDLLAPRSAQLVPDGPWTFKPGQTITVQWSPAEDLASGMPVVDFVADGTSGNGEYDHVPVAVAADRASMTLVLPTTTSSGHLEFWVHGNSIDISWPHCTGAVCRLSQTPQIARPSRGSKTRTPRGVAEAPERGCPHVDERLVNGPRARRPHATGCPRPRDLAWPARGPTDQAR